MGIVQSLQMVENVRLRHDKKMMTLYLGLVPSASMQ